ncbi:MAG: hypothetical protein UU46_C0011G0046, partial [Candidatus Uhrbacteria bacterium GW2011_GWD1_41_16]
DKNPKTGIFLLLAIFPNQKLPTEREFWDSLEWVSFFPLTFFENELICQCMNNQQLERLIRVSRKTGSPVIILDESGEETVLLPLSTYESLLDEGLYSFEEDDIFEEDQHIEHAPVIDLDDIEHGLYQPKQNLENNVDAVIPILQRDEVGDKTIDNVLDGNKGSSDDFVNEEQFYLEPIE